MIPWIFTHSPLEHWLPDYQRTFDAWEDGGVRGIVFGYLQFMQDDGTTIRDLCARSGGVQVIRGESAAGSTA